MELPYFVTVSENIMKSKGGEGVWSKTSEEVDEFKRKVPEEK